MISAKDVAKRFKSITPIDRIVRESIRNISREINSQTREGKTVIEVTLSKLYDSVGDLSHNDVRVLVYAGIIQELEVNGYNVKFKLINKSPKLYISTGVNVAHEMDVNIAKEYVKRHLAKPEKSTKIPTPQPKVRIPLPPTKNILPDWSSNNNSDIFDILNNDD